MFIMSILRTVGYILVFGRVLAFVKELIDEQKEIERLEAIRDRLEIAYQEQHMLEKAA